MKNRGLFHTKNIKMVIHFQDRDNKYMCNKYSKVKNEKMTTDKRKVTCKTCKQQLEKYKWGEKQK